MVRAASFNSVGTAVVTASDDGTARVWDLSDAEPASVILMGHRGGIVIAGFSPDDHWIVTASDDTTARLWPYFADIGKLTRIVRPTLGRCLTQSQREAYGLPVTDTTVDRDRVVAPDTAGKCPQIDAPAAHSVDGSGLLLPVGG